MSPWQSVSDVHGAQAAPASEPESTFPVELTWPQPVTVMAARRTTVGVRMKSFRKRR